VTASPDVTVVVPTRNRAALLRVTMRSALAQKGVDLEVVVVDDGSVDGTPQILAELADDRIRVVRHARPQGVARARNTGVEASTGRWIAFLDDDDLWVPAKLSRQVAEGRRTGRRWVFSSAVKFTCDARRAVLWQRMPAPPADQAVGLLPWRNLVPAGASNVLAERSFLLSVGGFDPELRQLSDWDLWIRMSRSGAPATVSSFDVAYRQHHHSMSRNPQGILQDAAAIDARTLDLRDGRPLPIAPVHLWVAASHMREGRRVAALRSSLAALRCGDRRGLRGVARALVPIPPRPPEQRAPAPSDSDRAALAVVASWLQCVACEVPADEPQA
jgi:GT2 family glycosyltransferase